MNHRKEQSRQSTTTKKILSYVSALIKTWDTNTTTLLAQCDKMQLFFVLTVNLVNNVGLNEWPKHLITNRQHLTHSANPFSQVKLLFCVIPAKVLTYGN